MENSEALRCNFELSLCLLLAVLLFSSCLSIFINEFVSLLSYSCCVYFLQFRCCQESFHTVHFYKKILKFRYFMLYF